MNILQKKLKFTREIVDAALAAGWDAAAITGRDHLTKVIETTEKMVVGKEQNGRVTLFPYARITDMHPAEEMHS